jgi:hypothetical protein
MEIPHTLVVGLIMYSMVCKTTRYVQYSKVVASIDTKVIKSTDHGTTVKKGH